MFSNSAQLIIPDVYGRANTRTAIAWLQKHLSFPDEYLAQFIVAPEERFTDWKTGGQTLTKYQIRKLRHLLTAINRFLSFYGFRRDLMMRILDVHTDKQLHPTSATPPWAGTSLKEYILHHGISGVDKVDYWVQHIKSANAS